MPRLDDLSAWAKLCGFDSTCVHLCQVFDERVLETIRINPALVTRPFLDEKPEAGKSYVACVRHPFIAQKGEPFWFLHQPPYSLFNGWDEKPEEIYESLLLHAVLDRVLHRGKDFALIVITIQEVLRVSELHERFSETRDEKVFSAFDDEFARRAQWARWLNYVYVFWDLESDVGIWWLFRQDEIYAREPQYRLVLQGHWGWHDELVWAGNQRLSTDEAAKLHSFMLR